MSASSVDMDLFFSLPDRRGPWKVWKQPTLPPASQFDHRPRPVAEILSMVCTRWRWRHYTNLINYRNIEITICSVDKLTTSQCLLNMEKILHIPNPNQCAINRLSTPCAAQRIHVTELLINVILGWACACVSRWHNSAPVLGFLLGLKCGLVVETGSLFSTGPAGLRNTLTDILFFF